jgi:hypothetical protein
MSTQYLDVRLEPSMRCTTTLARRNQTKEKSSVNLIIIIIIIIIYNYNPTSFLQIFPPQPMLINEIKNENKRPTTHVSLHNSISTNSPIN